MKNRSVIKDIHDAIDCRYEHSQMCVEHQVDWHYVEFGDSLGTVVFLLHGLPECWYSWYKVIPLLNPKFHIIAIDLKGYGRSTAYDNDYDWHHLASQFIRLCDALHIRKFHIVGHDWGAIISSAIVSDYPERILSFTRMEAELLPLKPCLKEYIKKPQWLLFRNEKIGCSVLRKANWFIHLCYQKRGTVYGISEEDRCYFLYEFSRKGVSESAAQYFLPKNRDMKALFDRIAFNNYPFPVQQLQADSDQAQPLARFMTIEKQCQNVRLVVIKNSGHFSNLDQPQQVADAINAIVEEVSEHVS